MAKTARSSIVDVLLHRKNSSFRNYRREGAVEILNSQFSILNYRRGGAAGLFERGARAWARP